MIEKILVVNTIHVSKEDIKKIDNAEYPNVVMQHPNGYGCLLHVGNPKEEGCELSQYINFTEGFRKAIKKAHEHDCLWVILDGDGDEHDDLERFKW